jgi:hypothetical protein
MDMRLRHVDNAQPLGSGRTNVLRDIQRRVNDDRFTRPLAPNEVAGLRQIIVVEVFEEHRVGRVVRSVARRTTKR